MKLKGEGIFIIGIVLGVLSIIPGIFAGIFVCLGGVVAAFMLMILASIVRNLEELVAISKTNGVQNAEIKDENIPEHKIL